MTTVLSGVSGAFYYKPGGTIATFGQADIIASSSGITTLSGQQLVTLSGQPIFTGSGPSGGGLQFYDSSSINIGTGFNFKPGDPVMFRLRNTQSGGIGSGILPAPILPLVKYYVVSYDLLTGLLIISTDPQLSQLVDISDTGLAVSPNKFEVYYSDFSVVSEIRSWTLELSRAEIDTTAIGKSLGQFFSSRSYISGYGDASGVATVYITDSDSSLSDRMIQDVMLRKQVGAAMKLYIDYIETDGDVDEVLSRSVEVEVSLVSASLSIDPDEGQMVDISFRPSSLISFDFSAS